MLVSMTLTLMQGHSESAKAKIQRCMLLATKQAISIALATTVGHFYVTLALQTFLIMPNGLAILICFRFFYVRVCCVSVCLRERGGGELFMWAYI